MSCTHMLSQHHLIHLGPHLISSDSNDAYAHALNLLSYAPAPSLPADHAYAYTKDWLAQHHLQTCSVYHLHTSTPPPHNSNNLPFLYS
ncbi:hypothetical protein O181_056990 [Austropuccinia psidii MF-1]|uniref:Uncharacterized protein n=1 Tax=Austropuccinia psidii MF-1 TaxID=1389203 RepID=A0A9Q3E742_9BASI|nr:hypothetical protein [Austropuccinia psidii MF-1]